MVPSPEVLGERFHDRCFSQHSPGRERALRRCHGRHPGLGPVEPKRLLAPAAGRDGPIAKRGLGDRRGVVTERRLVFEEGGREFPYPSNRSWEKRRNSLSRRTSGGTASCASKPVWCKNGNQQTRLKCPCALGLTENHGRCYVSKESCHCAAVPRPNIITTRMAKPGSSLPFHTVTAAPIAWPLRWPSLEPAASLPSFSAGSQ